MGEGREGEGRARAPGSVARILTRVPVCFVGFILAAVPSSRGDITRAEFGRSWSVPSGQNLFLNTNVTIPPMNGPYGNSAAPSPGPVAPLYSTYVPGLVGPC